MPNEGVKRKDGRQEWWFTIIRFPIKLNVIACSCGRIMATKSNQIEINVSRE